MRDTREGEEEVRELATGSTTSSSVIELMSNQASETLPATFNCQNILTYSALTLDVKSMLNKVQSLVQDRVLDVVVHRLTAVVLYWIIAISAEAAATLLVLQKHLSLYLVDGFNLGQYFDNESMVAVGGFI